jgi:carbonic anhydrase
LFIHYTILYHLKDPHEGSFLYIKEIKKVSACTADLYRKKSAISCTCSRQLISWKYVFQVNCLQQLQNIASYGFLKRRLETHTLHVHALWFDIYTGDIYYFSRQNKRFVDINEVTFSMLEKEVLKYYS